MYCDKSRRKLELAEALRTAYDRIQLLGNQEKEEFNNRVKAILLSICGNKEAVMDEILNRTKNGVDDMAFKYGKWHKKASRVDNIEEFENFLLNFTKKD